MSSEPVSLARGGSSSHGRVFIETKLEPDSLSRVKWFPDGKSALFLNRTGLLRQFSVPDLEQLRQVDVGEHIRQMQFSARGIVLLTEYSEKIIVLSPRNLAVTKTIPVDGISEIAGAIGSSILVVLVRNDLYFLDPRSGEKQKIEPPPQKSPSRSSPSRPGQPNEEKEMEWPRYRKESISLSTKGDALYLLSDHQIYKFSLDIRGKRLSDCRARLEQVTVKESQVNQPERFLGFQNSPSAPFLALHYGNKATMDAAGNHRLDIYNTRNLTRRVSQSRELRLPFAVSSDQQTFYARDASKGDRATYLSEVRPGGKITVFPVGEDPAASGNILSIEPRPDDADGGLLILTHTKLFWSAHDPSHQAQTTGSASVPEAPPGQSSSLKGITQVDNGRSFARLEIEARQITTDICWAPDGKTVFLLDKTGSLLRLQAPEMKQTASLDFKTPVMRLQLSRHGILVLQKEPRALLVISPRDMTIAKTVPLPDLDDFCASIYSPLVVGVFNPSARRLGFIDIETGATAEYDRVTAEKARPAHGSVSANITINASSWPLSFLDPMILDRGRTLFSRTSYGEIYVLSLYPDRMGKIDRHGLKLEGMVVPFNSENVREQLVRGAPLSIGPGATQAAVCVEKYETVKHVRPDKSVGVSDNKEGEYLYIYDTSNMIEPKIKWKGVRSTCGFDEARGLYYGQGVVADPDVPPPPTAPGKARPARQQRFALRTMDVNGKEGPTASFIGPEGDDFRKILPRPGSQKGEMLILTKETLYWSERL
ncbi:MAG: hypothetical protein RRC34_00290 [Lentisphaeria bacterium]|nr:hypothetical protein [Lentisphaeria bacterium]